MLHMKYDVAYYETNLELTVSKEVSAENVARWIYL